MPSIFVACVLHFLLGTSSGSECSVSRYCFGLGHGNVGLTTYKSVNVVKIVVSRFHTFMQGNRSHRSYSPTCTPKDPSA